MNSEVLYLKWRPNTFSDVIGQDNIINYFKNSIFNNKIHHSYLFSGNKGVGKTTVARLLAKSLNCSNININKDNNNFPCNICDYCLLINIGKFIDFIEIDASIKSGVDDIKEFLNGTQYSPVYGKYKIYLIDEIHILSKQGFSSLLKILEEPPKYIKFILATTEINKIPETILSRCIIFNFNEISNENIVNRLIFILNKENILYEIKALYKISYFSKGSIRDALNIIEHARFISNNSNITLENINNILGIYNINFLINILYSIMNYDSELLSKYLNKKQLYILNYNNIFSQFLSLIHNILMLINNDKYIIDYVFNDYYEDLYKLSKNYELKKFYKIYKIFLENKKELIYYNDERIIFEISIIYSLYIINN